MKVNLEDKILNKIKKEGIRPKSRLVFVFKNIFFWFLTIFSIFVGGLSFALVFYKISGDYYIFNQILKDDFNLSEIFIFLLPTFWIILLFIFLFLAFLNYRKTRFFYRYNWTLVISIIIIISMILGIVFFHFGLARKTEEFSEKYLPFYSKYLKIQEARKNIFIKRMKDLGLTKEILEQNPELRKKVEEKFERNVLGKIYLYRSPDICLKDNFKCQEDQIFFEDEKGCGCREIYSNLNF